MRISTVVLAAMLIAGFVITPQSTAVHAPSSATVELTDAFPGDPKVDTFALTADERHTYYTNSAGEAWVYDRVNSTKERIAAGPLWDLNLSRTGDALAYTKAGDNRGDRFVWILPLDPRTGRASGPERQLSTHQGDVPAISADGKFVAFASDDATGVGQNVVVVPIQGGAERVVAGPIPSSLANIRWTPDGKTLVFGVNPPVACVPEWSCLPLAQELRQPPGSIRRVPVAGGDMTTIALTRRLSPGLSPDGTTLMYPDTGPWRRWVIANADGTRRQSLQLPSTQVPAGWLRGSTLMLASSGSIRRLRSMTLGDGQSQLLMDDADALSEPSWSPDSRLMMTIAAGASNAELRIMNADGTPSRTLPLPDTTASHTAWSPDQKWIAYVGSDATSTSHIAIVDSATGQTKPLSGLSTDVVSLRWLADSRSLIVTETTGKPPNRRVVFKRVDLDGRTTVLRELATAGNALVVDDKTAVVMEGADAGFRAVSLSGDPTERELLAVRDGDSPAGLSLDGKWLAVRRAPAQTDGPLADTLELVRIDGSAPQAIPLSFAAAPNRKPQVLFGADQVIVFEAKRSDVDPSAFLVSANTPVARKLFSYSSQFNPPDLAVSPDGRRLLYLVWETLPPQLLLMDLSARRSR